MRIKVPIFAMAKNAKSLPYSQPSCEQCPFPVTLLCIISSCPALSTFCFFPKNLLLRRSARLSARLEHVSVTWRVIALSSLFLPAYVCILNPRICENLVHSCTSLWVEVKHAPDNVACVSWKQTKQTYRSLDLFFCRRGVKWRCLRSGSGWYTAACRWVVRGAARMRR